MMIAVTRRTVLLMVLLSLVRSGDVGERSVYLPAQLGPVGHIDADRYRYDDHGHRHAGSSSHAVSKRNDSASRRA
jgi:hypothetical protein